MKNQVTITCYGEKETWKTGRADAIRFYDECVHNSEGAEKERYECIMDGLRSGKTVIFDDMEEQWKYDKEHPENVPGKKDPETEAKIIASGLSPAVKDALYRILWGEHVLEDVVSQMAEDGRFEGYTSEEMIDIAETVADRYVNDGKYDCNLPYWDNIQNLIEEEADFGKEDIGREK